ncbi:MAG: insulinase family protein, partial [Bacteroidales bacterium]|nr:insulinase family protein [Bacteroidales bacterium]
NFMRFEHFQLDNGLTVLAEINDSALSTALGFFVRTGSRDETPEVSGVSHFLEHMLFKGTDKRSALDVNLEFDQMGAKYNAFTSEENTVYYACVLPEYQGRVMELWSDLMRPGLKQEDFDVEKGVILEEIAMYKDLPHFDVIDKCRSQHYKGYPSGNSVLGTNESITELTGEQMRNYFASRYSPDNIILACSGKVDLALLKSQANELCGSWQAHKPGRTLADFAGTGTCERHTSANVQRDHICLMLQGPSAQNIDRYAAGILAGAIGDEGNSRLHWALVDKALADYASFDFESLDGTGLYYSYISCDPDKTEQVLEIVKRELTDIRANGITEDELQTGKNKTGSARIISSEVPMGRLVPLGMGWMYRQEYMTVKEELEKVNAVTLEQINKTIELYPMEIMTATVLGPEG